MAVSRADRRLLLFTTVLVVTAGVLVAGLLWIATKGTAGTDAHETAPIYVGYEKQLRSSIRDEGPQYIPNPFGDHGFWLDMENDHFVAYVLDLPSKGYCPVKWKEPRNGYIDCHGDKVSPNRLDQYTVTLSDKPGLKRSVYVDLRTPAAAPTTTPSP